MKENKQIRSKLSSMEAARIEGHEKTAVRVSVVSIAGNTLLSLFKLLAGVLARSGAMISDDKEHPYGHERFECVAAIVLSVILLVTGLFIGESAVEKISAGEAAAEMPGSLALVAAAVSIVCKELMFWYTRFHAKRIDSGALMAEAWHHRSDALSSIGALIGRTLR